MTRPTTTKTKATTAAMSDLEAILDRMVEDQARLLMRVAEIERRNDNQVRHGKVTDVDTKKQRVRIEIGERDGKPVKSPWVPYAQVAGEYKSHTPPTKGQQMTIFAPNGEFRQAIVLPFTWSDNNKSPSEKEDEHVDTYGDKWKFERKKDLHRVTLDKASREIKPKSIIDKLGNAQVKVEEGKITISVGGSSITLEEAKVVIKSKKIVTDGETYLGSEEAEAQVELTTGPATMVYGI